MSEAIKDENIVLTGLVVFASIFALSGCGQSDSKTKASADSSNTRYLVEKLKKQDDKVLENDTAISKGYFKEVLAAFNGPMLIKD